MVKVSDPDSQAKMLLTHDPANLSVEPLGLPLKATNSSPLMKLKEMVFRVGL
jgi:hypothetical protein